MLDDYIKEMSATFQHLFKQRSITLRLDLNAPVSLDTFPGPLSQVVINLVQNALVHGFEKNDTGVITISTCCLNQNTVKLEVIDNGIGINPDIIDRLFEPFFTTKLGQGGSGLGLHIVYNIVTEMLGGELSVSSDQDKRITRFVVKIPHKQNQSLLENSSRPYDVQRDAA